MKHIDNFKVFESKFWDKLKQDRKNDKILQRADIDLKLHLKKYLLKKFSFQYSLYIWKSNNENYEEIDVNDFEFIDIMVQPYFGESEMVEKFFLYLYFVDKDGDKIAVYFTDSSPTEKLCDLDYAKPLEKNGKVLDGDYTEQPDLDKKDYKNEKIYPLKNSTIDLVPADYNTIQFLKDVKDALNMINLF